MNHRLLTFFLGFLTLCLTVPALAEQPLPQEGKKTVFQRVVSHPEATLYKDAAASAVAGHPITFTPYYVYERQGEMLRVGTSSSRSDGWLKKSEITDWPQAITALFTDRMGRQPVLFFKSREDLKELCTSPSIKTKVEQYVTIFKEKAPIPQEVLTIEPLEEEGQIAQKDFYLMPVLSIDSQFSSNGTQLLEVACITPGQQKSLADDAAAKRASGMSLGIVFIIDTTISMKPYIDQTRAIIRKVYDRLQKSPAKDKVAVAVVAFRSNVKLRPGIEYNTRIVSDFTTVDKRESLERLLEEVEESRASTHDFNEDAIAGVKEAVDRLSWDKINARAMLLVTDAGPLAGDDPTSKTHMTPEGMADYLQTNKIFLTTVHIKTPNGQKNHAYAEKNYRQLSMLSNKRSSYVPINALTPEQGAKSFDSVGNLIAESYCNLAEKQLKNEGLDKPDTKDLSKNASIEDQARRSAEAIGYSMRLQFRGDSKQTRAPGVARAWIADADLPALERDPYAAPVPAVRPAVLLTKAQLSELRNQVKRIIETAEEALYQDTENFNFYEQLLSAAAQMSRDPSAFNKDPNANLAQKGVLNEVLDGLPYKSAVLSLKEGDWQNMSTGEQQDFIKRLKGLVRRYEEYDRSTNEWEGFGSKEANEWVCRIPLDLLP